MPNQPAPCIAVIGPANAGKTTILNQLDEKLKQKLDSVLVIKGNPDGTGRYQYHSPDLRNEPDFKASVKGKWGTSTIERICEWVTHGRDNLSLALLDFGGRHDELTKAGNAQMLHTCSHFLVVSRDTDPDGAAYWDAIGRDHGLIPLGWMRSLKFESATPQVHQGGFPLEATFQVDVPPGNPINDAALAPLVDALVALSHPADRTPYVNLRKKEDWTPAMIPDVGGQAHRIEELASRTGAVVLGGAAPLWAYLAALRCALKANNAARVFFYDPKQPERLVKIPPAPLNGPTDFPADALAVSWAANADERSVLKFEITTPDKFLPPTAAQNLAGAPRPPDWPSLPSSNFGLSGAVPMWLHGTYARWLLAAGAGQIAPWDGRSKAFIEV